MSFKLLPNTKHWYQWTYAVVETNWNLAGQGLLILNNGDVWVWLENWQAPSVWGETSWAAWVGVVSPEGNVRMFGDLWAHGSTEGTTGLRETDTFAPHSSFVAALDGSDCFTDGQDIFLIQHPRFGD